MKYGVLAKDSKFANAESLKNMKVSNMRYWNIYLGHNIVWTSNKSNIKAYDTEYV
jgi:hypothetical protein